MIAVALTALWLGGTAFALLLVLCAAGMIWEWIGLARALPAETATRLLWSMFGIAYIALAAVALQIMRDHSGLAATLWLFAIVWATDIGAYFSGRTIGGPKLAPAISPNKTWAGLIGGAVAAGATGAIIAASATLPSLLFWLGAPLAVLAQMGDLFESWLKRRAGKKDSGRLIPGHGGLLDRLDGMLPVAIAALALMRAGAL